MLGWVQRKIAKIVKNLEKFSEKQSKDLVMSKDLLKSEQTEQPEIVPG